MYDPTEPSERGASPCCAAAIGKLRLTLFPRFRSFPNRLLSQAAASTSKEAELLHMGEYYATLTAYAVPPLLTLVVRRGLYSSTQTSPKKDSSQFKPNTWPTIIRRRSLRL